MHAMRNFSYQIQNVATLSKPLSGVRANTRALLGSVRESTNYWIFKANNRILKTPTMVQSLI